MNRPNICKHREGGRECGAPAENVISLPTTSRRPPAVGGPYCDDHGGDGRAYREARQDWNYLAPESVGDALAVLEAGKAHLDTTNAYVVIRPVENGTGWLAWLGLGSYQVQVANPAKPEGKRGSSVFETLGEAEAGAFRAWESRLIARLATIKAARGGTLSWGEPVEPMERPTFLRLQRGSTPWDQARAQPVKSMIPPGLSGLRPTGELL